MLIQKAVAELLDLNLIRHVGKHRQAALRQHDHGTGAGLFVSPAILPLGVKVKPVACMLDRGHPIAGLDQLRDEAFDQRRFAAVGPPDET